MAGMTDFLLPFDREQASFQFLLTRKEKNSHQPEQFRGSDFEKISVLF